MNHNRIISPSVVLILFGSLMQAQTNQVLTLDAGVTPHNEIDAVYRTFSLAYDRLDPALVSNLYGSEAFYLAPGREIQKGREEIHKGFKGFFDWAKEKGRTLSIAFRIVERGVSGTLAYDIGIYTLKGSGGGMPESVDQGKFIVIARESDNGAWYFQVDGYSALKPAK
jgi:ketosteroid isomerase-like protein